MSAPRVLFVDGDGDLPRGVSPAMIVEEPAGTAYASGGLDLVAFETIPEPRTAEVDAIDAGPAPIGGGPHGAIAHGSTIVSSTVDRSAAGAAGGRRPAWVMWRLLSGNNRELGRGSAAFTGLDAAVAAVLDLRSRLHSAQSAIVREPRPGEWVWHLSIDDVPVARSSRTYQRLRECEYSLAGFLESLPQAQLLADPARVVHQRRHHAAAVEPHTAPPVEVR